MKLGDDPQTPAPRHDHLPPITQGKATPWVAQMKPGDDSQTPGFRRDHLPPITQGKAVPWGAVTQPVDEPPAPTADSTTATRDNQSRFLPPPGPPTAPPRPFVTSPHSSASPEPLRDLESTGTGHSFFGQAPASSTRDAHLSTTLPSANQLFSRSLSSDVPPAIPPRPVPSPLVRPRPSRSIPVPDDDLAPDDLAPADLADQALPHKALPHKTLPYRNLPPSHLADPTTPIDFEPPLADLSSLDLAGDDQSERPTTKRRPKKTILTVVILVIALVAAIVTGVMLHSRIQPPTAQPGPSITASASRSGGAAFDDGTVSGYWKASHIQWSEDSVRLTLEISVDSGTLRFAVQAQPELDVPAIQPVTGTTSDLQPGFIGPGQTITGSLAFATTRQPLTLELLNGDQVQLSVLPIEG